MAKYIFFCYGPLDNLAQETFSIFVIENENKKQLFLELIIMSLALIKDR